ncbi:MAG: hypothetical protein AAGF79_06470 [Pseudomonadota bacterium]
MAHLAAAFNTQAPHQEIRLTGQEIIDGAVEALPRSNYALSLTSKVCMGTATYHLPLMNIHPEVDTCPQDLLRTILDILPDQRGVLVATGRNHHFIGTRLLTTEAWPAFLSSFLMPIILVSPRYIGHALNRGAATLRLFPCPPMKPEWPVVVAQAK